MTFDALKDHLVNAVATAAILGGGALVFQGKVDNARQDERIARVEIALEAIPEIQKDVRATRESVIRLEQRIANEQSNREATGSAARAPR